MTTDERNFRSSYYEKVGCFSVEEKKSLNKLLQQDNIRNHAKLKQFCMSYAVPTAQRALLWSIILGILPLHKNSTDYIQITYKQIYEDLLRAVTVMHYIDQQSTPKSLILWRMWLLENNRLLHNNTTQEQGDDNNFIEIVNVLLQIFENDVETYWIAKEFYLCTKDMKKECTKLKDITQALLKREDIVLHNHLERLGVFEYKDSILDKWYGTCFASVISDSVLIKIWDKICGGSRKIVIFLFLELVKTMRESVMSCNTQNEMKLLLEKVKDQDAVIVNKAIKTWQSNKTHCENEHLH